MKPSDKAPARCRSHRILWIEVIGGFLDGLRVEFPAGFATVIGSRGTGKSTLIELIRFALNVLPADPQARKRVESIISHNLEGGRVEVGIETKEGLRYIVTRSADEDPSVFTDDRKPTTLLLNNGTRIFAANIFSQNEVEDIADSPRSQLELIDGFEREQISDLNKKIARVHAQLSANSETTLPLVQQFAELNDDLQTLPSVEAKLKGRSKKADAGEAKIDLAQEEKSRRVRESQLADESATFFEDQTKSIQRIIGTSEQHVDENFHSELLNATNAKLMSELRKTIALTGSRVDEFLGAALKEIETGQAKVVAVIKALKLAHAEQDHAYHQLVEKSASAHCEIQEREELEQMRTDLISKQHAEKAVVKRIGSLKDERTELLSQLRKLQGQRFELRNAVGQHVSKELDPAVRVRIMQNGDRSAYQKLLDEKLRSAPIKHQVAAKKIANAIAASELVHMIEDRKHDEMAKRANLTPEQVEQVIRVITTPAFIHQLETVEETDMPVIDLRDGDRYKRSTELSTGQKCTAILPILLLDSANPLLVDQPEDNLDNSFVFNAVVPSVQAMKKKRQIIFITHNPNIPVLGNSDRVFVMTSDGHTAHVAKQGSVDQCRKEIITLLEGGLEAFRRRSQKYKLSSASRN